MMVIFIEAVEHYLLNGNKFLHQTVDTSSWSGQPTIYREQSSNTGEHKLYSVGWGSILKENNCPTQGLNSLSLESFNQDYIFAFNICLCLISCKVVSLPDPEAVLLLKYLTNEHPQLAIISSL